MSLKQLCYQEYDTVDIPYSLDQTPLSIRCHSHMPHDSFSMEGTRRVTMNT